VDKFFGKLSGIATRDVVDSINVALLELVKLKESF
jgi:hypothetical protein